MFWCYKNTVLSAVRTWCFILWSIYYKSTSKAAQMQVFWKPYNSLCYDQTNFSHLSDKNGASMEINNIDIVAWLPTKCQNYILDAIFESSFEDVIILLKATKLHYSPHLIWTAYGLPHTKPSCAFRRLRTVYRVYTSHMDYTTVQKFGIGHFGTFEWECSSMEFLWGTTSHSHHEPF